MSNVVLIEKINRLPEHLKVEVMDFVEFLELKNSSEKKLPLKERIFGSAKGKIFMAPDFDDPLEDFKDYM